MGELRVIDAVLWGVCVMAAVVVVSGAIRGFMRGRKLGGSGWDQGDGED